MLRPPLILAIFAFHNMSGQSSRGFAFDPNTLEITKFMDDLKTLNDYLIGQLLKTAGVRGNSRL
jgi:hypothetical protein